MKSLLLVAALVLAVPIASFIPGAAARATAAPSSLYDVAYQGKITGWSVAVDGTVTVRLEGTRDGEAFSLWFATPASRTSTTRYEDLVLEAVLAASGPLKDVQVTVLSDNEDAGDSIEDALVLNSISQR